MKYVSTTRVFTLQQQINETNNFKVSRLTPHIIEYLQNEKIFLDFSVVSKLLKQYILLEKNYCSFKSICYETKILFSSSRRYINSKAYDLNRRMSALKIIFFDIQRKDVHAISYAVYSVYSLLNRMIDTFENHLDCLRRKLNMSESYFSFFLSKLESHLENLHRQLERVIDDLKELRFKLLSKRLPLSKMHRLKFMHRLNLHTPQHNLLTDLDDLYAITEHIHINYMLSTKTKEIINSGDPKIYNDPNRKLHIIRSMTTRIEALKKLFAPHMCNHMCNFICSDSVLLYNVLCIYSRFEHGDDINFLHEQKKTTLESKRFELCDSC